MSSKALSWDDLANQYDKTHGGRAARTLPMSTIAEWACSRTDLFYVDPNTDEFHLVGNL